MTSNAYCLPMFVLVAGSAPVLVGRLLGLSNSLRLSDSVTPLLD
ncbi:hypothetical protein OAL35_00775 [bacterium]|nr:hypothetical protein [bacterium]